MGDAEINNYCLYSFDSQSGLVAAKGGQRTLIISTKHLLGRSASGRIYILYYRVWFRPYPFHRLHGKKVPYGYHISHPIHDFM